MLDAFRQHIANSHSKLSDRPGIVACSAGIDSVVLAHLCAATGLNFSLAHCNFLLRGQESEDDERFVKDLANQLNVKLFSTRFETKAYAGEHRLSIQMAARNLRYQWFDELLKKNELSWVLTAHHLDDALETFLINLSRGTGLEGLSGIPEENNKVIRPLLPFTREQIQEYARQNNISWREDLSNEDTKYLRNKIRHEVVPLLKELHPTFLSNFANSLQYLSGSAEMLSDYVKGLRENLFVPYHKGYKISLEALKKLQPEESYMYEIFKPYGFTSWADIIALLTAMSGKEVHSKTHRLIKDRKHLILQEFPKQGPISETDEIPEVTGDLPLEIRIEEVEEIKEKNNTILYIDKETLNHKLTVRKWKKGDYFYPLGMEGRKKVSKFFKDEKMDAVAKQNQWLLCCGDDIVWIIGRRADDRFKITEKTRHILKVTLAE
ncbi:MAG: tRNA lysidine(34) synthetase TilS [Flavobacteriaceae bacterium]|nr:tRNA lysidine(34) synthetase TilS [Muriicola sp.]NNL39539.1 tRNA lysidine(34) synthetase TilS [Flavobacteriaceae bacterium]